MREDPTWAMEARKTVNSTGDRPTLFQNRLHKSPGSGRGMPSALRGQGRGAGGKDRTSKGKGGRKSTTREQGKAATDPDADQ
jgi:hypothetical protein